MDEAQALSTAADAIAAGVLGGIARVVGGGDDAGDVVVAVVDLDHADADADTEVLALPDQRMRVDASADLLGDVQCRRQRARLQEDSELVAAEPRRQVDRADPPEQERGEHLVRVACPMLFVQGTRDELADAALVTALVDRLRPRATLAMFDDADHGFHVRARSGSNDAELLEHLLDTVVTWIGRVCATPSP